MLGGTSENSFKNTCEFQLAIFVPDQGLAEPLIFLLISEGYDSDRLKPQGRLREYEKHCYFCEKKGSNDGKEVHRDKADRGKRSRRC
jgi:hypothetical protein